MIDLNLRFEESDEKGITISIRKLEENSTLLSLPFINLCFTLNYKMKNKIKKITTKQANIPTVLVKKLKASCL